MLAFFILEISGKANVYQISRRFLFRKMLVIKFYQFGVKHAECILHDCFTVGHMSVYNKNNTLECWTILLWCISPSHVHFCFLTIAYVISMYNGGGDDLVHWYMRNNEALIFFHYGYSKFVGKWAIRRAFWPDNLIGLFIHDMKDLEGNKPRNSDFFVFTIIKYVDILIAHQVTVLFFSSVPQDF